MSEKVIFFTAGTEATEGELAEIANLNAASVGAYEVLVMNGAKDAQYGAARNVPCDFVAGTIPTAYSGVDELTTDLVQTVLKDGDVLTEAGGGTITVGISAGTVTYTYAS